MAPEVEQPEQLSMMGTAGLQNIASMLWAGDYGQVFWWELNRNRSDFRSTEAVLPLPPSSYRARLHGRAAELYDERRLLQERDQLAIKLHANNQQRWSPSIMARSVAYFNLASASLQQVEGRQRRLASRPTTFQFMRMMRDCRPQPSWACGDHVDFFVADQTYEWVGMKKRGRRNTVERHDARGMPVEIRHEVYVNSIHVRLPAMLGTLSGADQQRIRANHGSPYTEPYANVLVPLVFATVDTTLHEFAMDALQPISHLAMSPASLSLAQIANAFFVWSFC
jgi:hypothetical protein